MFYATAYIHVCAFIDSLCGLRRQCQTNLIAPVTSRFSTRPSRRVSRNQPSSYYCCKPRLLFVLLQIWCCTLHSGYASPIRAQFRYTMASSQSSSQLPSEVSPSSPSSSTSNSKFPFSASSASSDDKPRSPRWLNPCKIQPHALDPNRDFAGAPQIDDEKLVEDILQAVRRSKSQAEFTMKTFLELLNDNDPTFVNATEEFRQDWLPKIAEPNVELFRMHTVETWYKKTFEHFQYFAVGLDQVLVDKVLHDGQMVDKFQQTEDYMYQILCELQLGMYMKGIKVDTDVLHDVMSKKYRNIQNDSRRNLRDYLILRDYIKLLQFTEKLFEYLKSN